MIPKIIYFTIRLFNKKKALRDAPAASAITNADTIAKLKDAWDSDTLGTNPYK